MRQAYRDDESLKLTPYEFQLLRFLVERINRVFSRQELLSRVWGYRHAGGGRTVDTHTLNLRRKLGDAGERLQSVLGVGYKLQKADGPSERPGAADRGLGHASSERGAAGIGASVRRRGRRLARDLVAGRPCPRPTISIASRCGPTRARPSTREPGLKCGSCDPATESRSGQRPSSRAAPGRSS